MSLDMSRLENVKNKGNQTVARCPACAELGQDKKGNHLIINPDGRFACVRYPGESGREHRQIIFRLVGIREPIKKKVNIKLASQASQESLNIKMNDVLGHIGRHFQSHLKKAVNSKIDKIDELMRMYEEILFGTDHGNIRQKEKRFSDKWDQIKNEDREQLVDRLFEASLLPEQVRQVREMFNGKIVRLI
jgi:hypothetical protein